VKAAAEELDESLAAWVEKAEDEMSVHGALQDIISFNRTVAGRNKARGSEASKRVAIAAEAAGVEAMPLSLDDFCEATMEEILVHGQFECPLGGDYIKPRATLDAIRHMVDVPDWWFQSQVRSSMLTRGIVSSVTATDWMRMRTTMAKNIEVKLLKGILPTSCETSITIGRPENVYRGDLSTSVLVNVTTANGESQADLILEPNCPPVIRWRFSFNESSFKRLMGVFCSWKTPEIEDESEMMHTLANAVNDDLLESADNLSDAFQFGTVHPSAFIDEEGCFILHMKVCRTRNIEAPLDPIRRAEFLLELHQEDEAAFGSKKSMSDAAQSVGDQLGFDLLKVSTYNTQSRTVYQFCADFWWCFADVKNHPENLNAAVCLDILTETILSLGDDNITEDHNLKNPTGESVLDEQDQVMKLIDDITSFIQSPGLAPRTKTNWGLVLNHLKEGKKVNHKTLFDTLPNRLEVARKQSNGLPRINAGRLSQLIMSSGLKNLGVDSEDFEMVVEQDWKCGRPSTRLAAILGSDTSDRVNIDYAGPDGKVWARGNGYNIDVIISA